MKFFFNNINKKSDSGFTLVEMILYVAILSVISVLVVNIIFIILRAFTDIRVSRDVNNAATVAIERMVREIRMANDIDIVGSIFGTHPGKLSMHTINSLGYPTLVEFVVENNLAKIRENGIDTHPLHPPSVVVDNLKFYPLLGSNSEAVRIEIELTGKRGNVVKTRRFYSTAVLRGGY